MCHGSDWFVATFDLDLDLESHESELKLPILPCAEKLES